MGSKRFDDEGPVSAQAPGVGGAPEGARSATGGATSTPGGGALQEGQRWSLRRKLAVVQRLLAGEALEIVSREIGVPIYQLEAWRDKAMAGMEAALKAHADDPTSASWRRPSGGSAS